MILVSLIGEQPIPNYLVSSYLKPDANLLVCSHTTLTVARRLEKLLPNSQPVELKSDLEYHLTKSIAYMQDCLQGKSGLAFNLTGGTKIMALAGFALASQSSSPFYYFQSEGHASVLYRYAFQDGQVLLEKREELPVLMSTDLYLKAHLPGYHLEESPKDDGGKFEQVVKNTLIKNGFEVLSGVRPEGVSDQIEIDLVIRLGNQVGIAEVKLSDKQEEGPKKGIDQLTNAGGREYLGTYTTRFLITGRHLSAGIKNLALQRNVWVIELSQYSNGRLNEEDSRRLAATVREKLSPPRR